MGSATTSATKAGSTGASTAAEEQSGASTKTSRGSGDGSSTTSSATASTVNLLPLEPFASRSPSFRFQTSSGGIDVGVSTKKKGVGYNTASYTDDLAITWACKSTERKVDSSAEADFHACRQLELANRRSPSRNRVYPHALGRETSRRMV